MSDLLRLVNDAYLDVSLDDFGSWPALVSGDVCCSLSCAEASGPSGIVAPSFSEIVGAAIEALAYLLDDVDGCGHLIGAKLIRSLVKLLCPVASGFFGRQDHAEAKARTVHLGLSNRFRFLSRVSPNFHRFVANKRIWPQIVEHQ